MTPVLNAAIIIKYIAKNDKGRFCILRKTSIFQNGRLFMKKNVKRDQLTFPVAVWKNGIDLADILTMGNNVYDNDLLRVCSNV